MKKVLVTGATGFIGRHAVPQLLRSGYEVVASSASSDKAARFDWYNSVLYKPLDLGKLDNDTDYFEYFENPDQLLHLGWEGLPNYQQQFHLTENLPRHMQFLQNLFDNGLQDFTIVGTCFEYGMQEGCLSESMPAMPANAYARAKDELRVFAERLVAQSPAVLRWVRLFYMFGEGQSPNSLLSQLQAALDRGDEQFNMSPGDQLRDYLPVETVARYLVEIMSQSKVDGIINCCSGHPVAVKQLVQNYLSEKKLEIKLNLGYYNYSPVEPMNFWGDTAKLKTIISNE